MASLTEKDALVTSIQEELRELREKQTNDAVRLASHTSSSSIQTDFLCHLSDNVIHCFSRTLWQN